jgi:Domain of unknown function DUF29
MADDLSAPVTDLYEADFYAWTQAQAALLRARAGSDPLLDWERLAEEVGDMGKRDLRGVRSFLARIIEHLLKLHWSQNSDAKPGWRAEIGRFRVELEDELTPTLRRLVEEDLPTLHARGAKLARLAFEAHEPQTPTPDLPAWTLPQILGEEDDPLG